MNRNILYVIVLAVATVAGSCTDDFNELNTDPKNLTVDQVGQGDFGLVVKAAQYSPIYFADNTGPRGSFQITQSLFSDIYANYFATTAPNFDSDKFILVGGWLNGAFNYFYGQAAPQIKNAEDIAAENGLELEGAMMQAWRVWAYHRMTDYWGPIPYSEFGNRERSVPYDSQEEIYRSFFVTLDSAVSVLQANAGTTSFLAGQDLLYGGNVDQWLRFTNTLRLRLAMRVRYADPDLAQAEAEKAVAAGVIESNDDNAFIETNADFNNPYNTITQWGEFRMSADMESILKGYKDPRVAFYAAPAAEPDPTDDPGVPFPYEGLRNGQSKADKQGIAFNVIASDMAAPYTERGAPGPAWPIIKAAEAYLLRAEGALVGWNMGGTTEELYNQGIMMSMDEYGLSTTNLDGANYIESDNTPASFNGEVPAASEASTALQTGGSEEQQLEQIITQKWIALYPDSREAWAEKRRTNYPVTYPRLNTDSPLIGADEIPRRVPFVDGEFTNNAEAVNNAIDNLLGGANEGTTRLWWDKK